MELLQKGYAFFTKSFKVQPKQHETGYSSCVNIKRNFYNPSTSVLRNHRREAAETLFRWFHQSTTPLPPLGLPTTNHLWCSPKATTFGSTSHRLRRTP